ncbi:MAG: MtaA/CmuA family methyltransferase [Thermodesulfobacteriota bacterium]|jgi:[methyl-Co(III) methanol-specific corrinoid protein]:coenzyme M methyltransferase
MAEKRSGILSPKRRFLSGLFGGRKGDRPPVGNPTSIVSLELMEKTGIFFPQAHLEAQPMAELAAAGHEILGFDSIMPEYSVQQEAAALGCQMDWGSPAMMPDARTHPIQRIEDLVIPKNLLEKPSLKVVLEALSLLRRQYGDEVAIIGKVMGPWTISYHLAGTQNFLLWVITEPEKVRRYLEALKEVTVLFAKAQFQAGADVVVLADHATGDLVSPKTYEKFLLPVHKELVQRIGGPLILHICGNCGDRLRMFVEAGFEGYHFEWQVDAREAVRAVNREMSLVGNINNPTTLLRGTPEDVRQQVRYSVAAGVDIIAPECAVPLQTPLRNLRAIVEAVEEGWG